MIHKVKLYYWLLNCFRLIVRCHDEMLYKDGIGNKDVLKNFLAYDQELADKSCSSLQLLVVTPYEENFFKALITIYKVKWKKTMQMTIVFF